MKERETARRSLSGLHADPSTVPFCAGSEDGLSVDRLRDTLVQAMKLTAVFEPAREGGYTCFIEESPAAISQGESLEEAKANLLDALKLVLQRQRELARKELSPHAVLQTIELAEA